MGLALFDGVLEVVCLGMGEILGGIGRVISEKSPTLGEITDTGVIRYRWKAAHLRGGHRLLPVCRPAGPENPSSHLESLTNLGDINKPELQ
jgi:hypothetical protein